MKTPAESRRFMMLLIPPGGGAEQHQQGHQLQTAHQHNERQHQLAEGRQGRKVRRGAEGSQRGAYIADAGQGRHKRLRKVQYVQRYHQCAGHQDQQIGGLESL